MESEMSSKENGVLTKQRRIAENARRLPLVGFTSLAYHMDTEWLEVAFNETKKNKAPGIDGVKASDYEEKLNENLKNLLEKAKSGKYYAPPVKRVFIPKGNGKEKRPLGIPTFEDKVLQRSIKMLIEPIFEQDFYESSYGFRPGKSQHQALKELREKAWTTNGWIIDLDISKYFDSIDHAKLREIYKQRVKDGVITRLLGKWLKAGIMEDKTLYYHDKGTPQGGVISPLLSNVYLHEVLDKWYVEIVRPRLKGESFIIRFADDVVMGFSDKTDAQRVMKAIKNRMEKYGLILHPDKTKIVKFQNPESGKYKRDDEKNGTFAFLGFTFYWGKSRKGKMHVRWKTSRNKFAAKLKGIKEFCKKNRHMKITELITKLNRKLKGHYAYYGISLNYEAISNFRQKVMNLLYKWLNRRNRNKGIKPERFNNILTMFPLAKARIVHSMF